MLEYWIVIGTQLEAKMDRTWDFFIICAIRERNLEIKEARTLARNNSQRIA